MSGADYSTAQRPGAVDCSTMHFDGTKNPPRRVLLESGEPLAEALPDGEIFVADVAEYRKTTTTFAVRMERAFKVETLEGPIEGKVGDWLAIGQAGEMYPIDAAVFAVTYEEVPDERLTS